MIRVAIIVELWGTEHKIICSMVTPIVYQACIIFEDSAGAARNYAERAVVRIPGYQ